MNNTSIHENGISVFTQFRGAALAVNQKSDDELKAISVTEKAASDTLARYANMPATVTLNIALVVEVAKQIGAMKENGDIEVSLWISESDKPILIRRMSEPTSDYGVVMPMRPTK